MNDVFNITDKAYPLNNNKLRIISFDKTGQQTDIFVFDYGKKYLMNNRTVPLLNELMRLYTVYTYSDRTVYVSGSVWILSIGINDYGEQRFVTCESDAKLKAYFREILPEFDEDRVYTSDIKKILNWYNLLQPKGFVSLEALSKEVKEEETPAAE